MISFGQDPAAPELPLWRCSTSADLVLLDECRSADLALRDLCHVVERVEAR
jgi:hypothetical protein